MALLLMTGSPWPSPAGGGVHQWEAGELTIEPLGGHVLAGGSAYRGVLHMRAEGGTVRIVNEVAVEDYVRGVREMPPSWPLEAQRAQAIAARSYALHQAGLARQKGRPVDLCATAACQVYRGVEAELQGGEAWARAVESTESQVLAYRGAPILAMYSSSNGGHTAAGAKPYLRAVADPDDVASPYHRWRVEVPETAVGEAVALPPGAQLTDVERDGSTVVARWEGPEGDVAETERPVPVAEFRKRLEAAHPRPPELPRLLPSIAFDVAPGPGPDSVVIEGRGWGHGIGMSQHGALGKARRGMDAARILASYYAGLTPVKAAPGQIFPTLRVGVATRSSVDVGGQETFRLRADGQEVATGVGPGWSVSARRGGLLLSAPEGWQPPEPLNPVVEADPFEAPPPKSRLQAVDARPAGPPGALGTGWVWRAVALALLLGVGAALARRCSFPDLLPIHRG